MRFKIFVLFAALGLLVFVGCDQVAQEAEEIPVDEPVVEAQEDTAKDPIPEGVVEPELNPAPPLAPVVTPKPVVLAPEPEPVHESSEEYIEEIVVEGSKVVINLDPPAEDLDEVKEITLAKCLTENGAKLYTASWCGHCNDQKEAFGEGLEYLNNTECAVDDGWADVCTEAEIKGVPTWIFGDGTRQSGNTSLVKLASLGGCTYNY